MEVYLDFSKTMGKRILMLKQLEIKHFGVFQGIKPKYRMIGT